MLKFILTDRSQIPTGLEAHYEERDGKWYLKVEGAVAKERLDEFRDNNTALTKEVTDLKAKYKDVDPDKFKELLTIETDLRAGKLKGTDAEKIVELRVAEMKKTHAAEIDKLTVRGKDLEGRLASVTINNAIVAAGVKAGMHPSASDDLVARGLKIFRLNEKGEVEALDAAGNPRFNDRTERFSISDFIAEQTQSAAHLFQPSNGTGGQGSGQRTGEFTGPNPYAKSTLNLTKQAELEKSNMGLARQLAGQAGVKID